MTDTTTLQSAPERLSQQPNNRPVVEALEKYRTDILDTLMSNAGTWRGDRQNSSQFINALRSLIANDPIFENALRTLGIVNGRQGAIAMLTTLNTSFVTNSGQAPNTLFWDLPWHQDVQLIITALAEYRRQQAQEQQNQFDALYISQSSDPTKSSTSQQIDGVAQKAKLTGAALYYRNGSPLRISYNPANDRFEAEIIDRQGQPSTIQGVQRIADLVTQIHAQSQPVRNISADTVQQNVEEREEVDFQQIAAAIEFINRGQNRAEREARTGFYSFDKTRFAIRGQWDGDFSIDIQYNEEGAITAMNNVSQNAVANIIKTHAKKKKEKKEGIETPDMGNDFSETIFRKLAREVSGSKDLVGDYKLNGQTFTLRQTSGVGVRPIRYQTQYPDHTGRKQTYPQAGQVNQASELNDIVTFLSQNIRTHGNEGNCTRDMGNDFSVNSFRDLAEEIGKSRNGRGNYKLAGKNYEIQAHMPMPDDINAVIFDVEHPNEFGIKINSHGTLDELLRHAAPAHGNHPAQVAGPMSHIHAHDPNHPAEFTQATMLRVLGQALATKTTHPDLAISDPRRRVQFDFHGKTCEAYVERLARAGGIECYCVDMPNSTGWVDKIWSTTQKGLYKDFMKKAHVADQKPVEHADKSKETPASTEAHKEWHADAGHAAHEDGHDTVLDKTFKAVLPGWLAKLATKGKNLIPESIRKFGWATVSTAVAGAAIGWAITGWVIWASAVGWTTIGNVAALGLFGPATLTFAGAIWGYKLYKWWKGDDKKDKDAHGGAH